MTRRFLRNRVVVRGAGEMASGVIRHLFGSGFEVIALEVPFPVCIRRYVCYAEALFEGEVTAEGITAVLVNSVEEASVAAGDGRVPVLVDPTASQLPVLAPMAVVDGRMLKRDIDADLAMAPIVIGLGPGFVAGENCHAAVETNRGDDLGRVYFTGCPRSDTGFPAPVGGFSRQRVLRSPADGEFISNCRITDLVKAGQILGDVAGLSVVSEIDGIVRGLVHDGLMVTVGQKIGDVDPRCEKERCYKMSEKANAIGKGTLEAITTLNAGIKQE
jgi:xanthine dehydrogenase accessory factor